MATGGDDGSAQGPATRIESSASLRVQLSRSSTTGYGTLDAGTSAGTAPARTGARTPHSRSVSAQELGNPSAADRDQKLGTKIGSLELEYSPFCRDIERNGALTACKKHGIPVLAYSP
ncbi:hypothetical protein OC834_006607, partial [Tilletia horrida]